MFFDIIKLHLPILKFMEVHMKKLNRMMLGILLVVLSLSVTPKAAFAEKRRLQELKWETKRPLATR